MTVPPGQEVDGHAARLFPLFAAGTGLCSAKPRRNNVAPLAPIRLRRTDGPSEPLPPGRPAFPVPARDPEDPLFRTGSRTHRPAAHQALHGRKGGRSLEDGPDAGQEHPGRPGRAGHARRRRRRGRQHDLHPAPAHGRVLRVLHDAHARRHRPEGPGGTLLPVSERRRGLHQGPLYRRRNPTWPRLRAGAHALGRKRRARARLRAGQRGHPHGLPPGHQHLLLPSQDAARGPRLRRAQGHLHDLQHLGRVPGPARPRPPGGHGRVPGPAGPGPGARPGAVRGERARAGQLHLQTAAAAAARP